MHKKPDMCNKCYPAVHWQNDGTIQIDTCMHWLFARFTLNKHWTFIVMVKALNLRRLRARLFLATICEGFKEVICRNSQVRFYISINYKKSYMRFNSCDYVGGLKELILRILLTPNELHPHNLILIWYCTCFYQLGIQLPTFVHSATTAITNKHLILWRRKISGCPHTRQVNQVKATQKIVEKIISPVLYGTNHLFKCQNTISLKTGL